MDNILLHREAWLPMRATSKHYRDMVDLMPHGHLVFAVEIEYLAYSAEDSAEDCTQCRYCGGTRFPWSFDYSIDDDSSDDEEEPCVCRETTYGLDRIVHFDISTPHHKLPGIHPRPYDASSSELVNGTTAAAVKALVKKAHILDLPLGLAEADLDWLQSEAENIEIVRYYSDPAIALELGPDTIPLIASTVVFSLDVYLLNLWFLFHHTTSKVVFNVAAHRPQTWFSFDYTDHEVFSHVNNVVILFHHIEGPRSQASGVQQHQLVSSPSRCH